MLVSLLSLLSRLCSWVPILGAWIAGRHFALSQQAEKQSEIQRVQLQVVVDNSNLSDDDFIKRVRDEGL